MSFGFATSERNFHNVAGTQNNIAHTLLFDIIHIYQEPLKLSAIRR